MDKVRYTRVYADAEGVSHAEDLEMSLEQAIYAPPAGPVWVSDITPATQYHFISGSPGEIPPVWHPAPHRQVIFWLRGKSGVELGDGTRRVFGHGDVVLVEDTKGRGHLSWVEGDEDVLNAVVVLPE